MVQTSTLIFKENEKSFSINVNGNSVVQKTIGEDVLCSCCNYVLVNFDSQPIKYRREYINANLKDKLIYCPHCGAKIDYSNACILDVNLTNNPTE